MRVSVITYILLLINFNSFSQKDTIALIHQGYSFQVEISTLIKHYQIEVDSVEYYKKGLFELFNKKPEISSALTLEFGEIIIDFGSILDIFDKNHSSIKIKRIIDNQLVKFKVKYIQVEDRFKGIVGGSSKTYIIIIDKKKRVEIVNEIISRSLAC